MRQVELFYNKSCYANAQLDNELRGRMAPIWLDNELSLYRQAATDGMQTSQLISTHDVWLGHEGRIAFGGFNRRASR